MGVAIHLYTSFRKMEAKSIIRIAAISGAAAVAIGAFGAHGLESMAEAGKVAADDLSTFDTAVRYQFYHTFALLATGLLAAQMHGKHARNATMAFLTGICIFSGSLYLLTLSEWLFGTRMSWLGAITPLGGLSFIVGWIMLLLGNKKR